MSFQSRHPGAKADWNIAMQQHLVYVAAALRRPVGELRVLLLDAPVVEADGRLGFPQTAWALARAGVDPRHIYVVERDPVGLAALQASTAGTKLSGLHLVPGTVGGPDPLPLPLLDLVLLDSCSNRHKVTQVMVPHLRPYLRPTAVVVVGICRNRNRDALPEADRNTSITHIQQQAARDLADQGGQPFAPLGPVLHATSHAPHTLMVYLAVSFGTLPDEPYPIRLAAGDWLTGVRLLQGEKKATATRALGMAAPPRHKRISPAPRPVHVSKHRLPVAQRWHLEGKRQSRKRKFLADEQAAE
jgi:hypothetical protein